MSSRSLLSFRQEIKFDKPAHSRTASVLFIYSHMSHPPHAPTPTRIPHVTTRSFTRLYNIISKRAWRENPTHLLTLISRLLIKSLWSSNYHILIMTPAIYCIYWLSNGIWLVYFITFPTYITNNKLYACNDNSFSLNWHLYRYIFNVFRLIFTCRPSLYSLGLFKHCISI